MKDSVMHRLYIGGLADSVKSEDLKALLLKLKDVDIEEVYLCSKKPYMAYSPASCFAIVRMQCSLETMQRAVKIFHNSTYKGCHLTVQVAKEHYLDRIKREKGMTGDTIKDCAVSSGNHLSSTAATKPPSAVTSSSSVQVLRVRKHKGARCLCVSAWPEAVICSGLCAKGCFEPVLEGPQQPTASVNERSAKPRGSPPLHCTQRIFLEDGQGDEAAEALLAARAVPYRRCERKAPDPAPAAAAPIAIDVTKDAGGSADGEAKPAAKKLGGGGRKGFGRLLQGEEEAPAEEDRHVQAQGDEAEARVQQQIAGERDRMRSLVLGLPPAGPPSPPSSMRKAVKKADKKAKSADSDNAVDSGDRAAAPAPAPAANAPPAAPLPPVAVDLHALHGIFHRGGGVHWRTGDTSISLGEDAALPSHGGVRIDPASLQLEGDAAGKADPLFLEAERLGLDIRPSAAASGDLSRTAAVSSAAAHYTFDFFGGSGGAGSAEEAAPSSSSSSSSKMAIASGGLVRGMAIASAPLALAEAAARTTEDSRPAGSRGGLLALAAAFRRSRSDAELAEAWGEEGREKRRRFAHKKRSEALKRASQKTRMKR